MVPIEPSPMRRMLTPAESVRAWGCEMSMVGLGWWWWMDKEEG